MSKQKELNMSKKVFRLDPNRMDFTEIQEHLEKQKEQQSKEEIFKNIISNAIYGEYPKCDKETMRVIRDITKNLGKDSKEFTQEQFDLMKSCFIEYTGWQNNIINATMLLEADKVLENVVIEDVKSLNVV